MREMLNRFEKALGRCVNLQKSSIFYSTNTETIVKGEQRETLEMQAANEHSTYLGLPSMTGKYKNAALGYLKERIKKRVQGWDARSISCAGKKCYSRR